MAKKLTIYTLTIIISVIIASVFGFLHNQISFSISNEYFTKFKFEQFRFVEYGLETPRLTSGIIGVWATWWFGLIIGVLFGLLGFFEKDWKDMFKKVSISIYRTILIVIVFGFLGIIIGKLIIVNFEFDWKLPKNLINQESFIIVGTMHNFSNMGGIIGLIYGVLFLVKSKKLNVL